MAETPIKYRFNESKATQAAAWLLKRNKGTMPYLTLMKILYISERESLRQYGHPVIGDFYVSMSKGPVLSNTLDLITPDPLRAQSDVWSRFIQTAENHTVLMKADPGRGELSDADIEILDNVADHCEGLGKWELVDLVHRFPEWQDPGRSSLPIAVEEILKALGKNEEQISRIREEAAEDFFLGRVLKS